MDILIKKIETTEELEQSFDIRRIVFIDEQNVPQDEEFDENDFPKGHFIHFLASVNDEPAGTVRMLEYDADTAKLQRLAVLRQYRGLHIGAALVEAFESEARAQGYRYVLLDGQTRARGFYERNGYAAVSEDIIMDAGIEHVRMKKAL